jgi:hypothetical protein
MSRPQLNIKFDGEGEKDLLETVKARAIDERLTLKEFVIDALRLRLEAKAPSQSTQASRSIPTVTKGELDEFRRRIANSEMALRGEIRKDRDQIAMLAGAIAAIEARLDGIVPPSPSVDDTDDTQDSQARQSNWREWEEHCEPGTGAWDTWNTDAVAFLDGISWENCDG